MRAITCIDDLKALHRARTPKMFYDYAESGSYTEQTFRENTTDFARIKLRQKVAVDMSNRSLAGDMAGIPVSMPVGLAPVGFTGMQHADGEIHAARAAEKFGVPFCLSTMSICSIEDVAEHTTAPFMFQLYVMKDQEFLAGIIERAKAAKCSALVLTLDLQILGQRHKDIKNGLSAPPKLTLPVMMDLATRWRWGLGMLQTKRRYFGNIVGHAKGVGDMSSLGSWTAEQFDERLDWDKVARIRDMWGGKLILKGILDPDDARIAADFGADAIVVSNHGGRQLDGALSRHPHAAAYRRGRGRPGRDPHGQRHPLGSGRAEGAGPWRPCHLDRARLDPRPRRDGRGRRHEGAGDHPQGAGRHDGPLRRAGREEPRPPQPAAARGLPDRIRRLTGRHIGASHRADVALRGTLCRHAPLEGGDINNCKELHHGQRDP